MELMNVYIKKYDRGIRDSRKAAIRGGANNPTSPITITDSMRPYSDPNVIKEIPFVCIL